MMYCRDDIVSVTLVHDAFLRYFEAFGLKANNDKSSLYIDEISDQTKQEIVNALRVQLMYFAFQVPGCTSSNKEAKCHCSFASY